MNETRGNARTKPMRGGLKGGEINSLKDSEKTNEYKINVKLTLQEIQALGCIAAEQWINAKNKNQIFPNDPIFKTNLIKNWKNLSEYLFKIYRINNK